MEKGNIEERVTAIEQELDLIKTRNAHVEFEKSWELSSTRKFAILILTYVIATIVLFLMNIEQPWLNAIIPTLGYYLSTLSLSWLKERWLKFRMT